MLLDDLALYLHTQGVGVATTSTGDALTIYRGVMPESPDTVLSLFEYGGLGPLHTMTTPARLELPRIQVLTRAPTYQAARTLAESAYRALDWTGNTTLTSTGPRYGLIQALQSPFFLDRDPLDRVRIACNYQVTKALST